MSTTEQTDFCCQMYTVGSVNRPAFNVDKRPSEAPMNRTPWSGRNWGRCAPHGAGARKYVDQTGAHGKGCWAGSAAEGEREVGPGTGRRSASAATAVRQGLEE